MYWFNKNNNFILQYFSWMDLYKVEQICPQGEKTGHIKKPKITLHTTIR